MANHEKVYGVCENKCFVNLFDVIYPVGSIYISANSTDPSSLFGGEWEAYATGRTLIGVGEFTDRNGITVDFVADRTGGEYNHTLTVNEIPSHSHEYTDIGNHQTTELLATGSGSTKNVIAQIDAGSGEKHTSEVGGDGSHNNVMPYIACYMWKRVG